MTDHRRVYTKVKKMLKQMMKMDHQGQVVTLAMMVSGIVMSRNAQLSAMSSEIPTGTKEKSIEMRLRRWVKDDIDVEAVYMPFARQILEVLSHLPLVLVMDGSQAGRGCMVLMVGVLYQKRALPIAWLVYKGKKGHASAERHIQALEKVLALVPQGSEVVLLGDAEYDTTEMISWVEKNTTWQYVLRTSPQIYVQTEQEHQPIRDYPLEQGKVLHLHNVGFTQTSTLMLNAIGWWASRYEEPIFLVTNMDNPYQTCRYYRRRFRIETFFSDQKSRGFHIHKSHLADPARLSRLLIAACLAYIWMICQGLQVIVTNNAALIDRTERIDKSVFRLGLDWIKYALKHRLDFQPIFHFQPLETPFHVR
ncbi:MAG: IS4 family transposase [Anaerolineales bacterium]